MPAWMTSLLRELVPVPKVEADSNTNTSLPFNVSSLATANPTTPAPITTQSTFSFGTPLLLLLPVVVAILRLFKILKTTDDDDEILSRLWILLFSIFGLGLPLSLANSQRRSNTQEPKLQRVLLRDSLVLLCSAVLRIITRTVRMFAVFGDLGYK